jgi:uncharacterized protein
MPSLTDDGQAALQSLQARALALCLFQDLWTQPLPAAWLSLLEALIAGEPLAASQAYGQWFCQLATAACPWPDALVEALLTADNPFSQQAQHVPLSELPTPLLRAAAADLSALQQIALQPPEQLATALGAIAPGLEPVVWSLAGNSTGLVAEFLAASDWSTLLPLLAEHYRHHGSGCFARHRALRWHEGVLQGIPQSDPVRLESLVGYDWQKATVVRNTEFLLQGSPAQNILLYGSRGSGKSSLIKALVNEYGDRGLRLLEVSKADLTALPRIAEQLRSSALKFVLFVDDLSFEEDDDAFKALKVVLEGSLTARPANLVVYATSNRRHLIREFFEDRPRPREADELHSWDTVQEKLSFSDRFGLTLTFEAADQSTYLQIVQHLIQQAGLQISADAVEFRARQWTVQHNGRSGRTARQFVDWLIAETTNNPRV